MLITGIQRVKVKKNRRHGRLSGLGMRLAMTNRKGRTNGVKVKPQNSPGLTKINGGRTTNTVGTQLGIRTAGEVTTGIMPKAETRDKPVQRTKEQIVSLTSRRRFSTHGGKQEYSLQPEWWK